MTHNISFCVFDQMIHENPMKWMTLENNNDEMVFFLNYLNQWIEGDMIGRLMISDLPPELEYMFNSCKDTTLISLKEEIVTNLN
jgi:hypothetical protein